MPALSAAWQSQEWITHGGGGGFPISLQFFQLQNLIKFILTEHVGFFFLDAEWRGGGKVTSTYSFCVKKAVKYKILL